MEDRILNEPSSFNPAPERELIGPRHLTTSQAAALRQLSDLARLQGQSERAGVTPRNKPLLVGPSGSGKTAVVRRLADVEECPLLVINAGSWIVFGAYTRPHTLSVIRRFVAENPRGCILIDEVDKACPGVAKAYESSWALGVFTEVITLLDGDHKLRTSGWTDAQIKQFQDSFYIVGAGAWQLHATAARDDSEGLATYSEKVLQEAGIPEEILFRFNSRLVEISAPTKKDFSAAIRRIRSELSLPALAQDEEVRLVLKATRSHHGMRWIEQYLSDLLVQSPQACSKCTRTTETKSEKLHISRQDYNRKLNDGFDLMNDLQVTTLNLHTKLNLSRQVAAQTSAKEKNRLTPKEFDRVLNALTAFSPALEFPTAISDAERSQRTSELDVEGRELLGCLGEWLLERASALKSFEVLEVAIEVQAGVRRLQCLWKHLVNVEIDEEA